MLNVQIPNDVVVDKRSINVCIESVGMDNYLNIVKKKKKNAGEKEGIQMYVYLLKNKMKYINVFPLIFVLLFYLMNKMVPTYTYYNFQNFLPFQQNSSAVKRTKNVQTHSSWEDTVNPSYYRYV